MTEVSYLANCPYNGHKTIKPRYLPNKNKWAAQYVGQMHQRSLIAEISVFTIATNTQKEGKSTFYLPMHAFVFHRGVDPEEFSQITQLLYFPIIPIMLETMSASHDKSMTPCLFIHSP